MDISTLLMIVFGCMLGGLALAGALYLIVTLRHTAVQKQLSNAVCVPENAETDQLLLIVINPTELDIQVREVNLKTEQDTLVQLKPCQPEEDDITAYFKWPDGDDKIWNITNQIGAKSRSEFAELPQMCGAYWGLDAQAINDPHWQFTEIELIVDYPNYFRGRRLISIAENPSLIANLQDYFKRHIAYVDSKEKYDMSKEFNLE